MSTISTPRRIAASLATTAVLATGAASAAQAATAAGDARCGDSAATRKAPARPAGPVRKATVTKPTTQHRKSVARKSVTLRSSRLTASPAAGTTPARTVVSTASTSAVTYAASTTVSTSGLSGNAAKVAKAVNANFPQITSIGGLRSGASAQDHGTGHAVDLMTANKATGDQIAAYMKEHASELGIKYVIWRQHIWSVQRADEDWRPMADRGSATANHFDHVHVSVN